MPLTVAEIVGAPHLSLELLAEGDLTRAVRWVHATDQPDPAPHLRGGEVVLTDGLWLGREMAPVDYVRRLADADVVALGFGLVDGGGPPPPALVRACRRRGLTLFAVPVDVPFLAISELFVDHVIQEREEPLRRTLARSERFLDAVAAEDGAAAVLAVLGAELGVDVSLWDRFGKLVASTDGRSARPPAKGDMNWAHFEVQGPAGTSCDLHVHRNPYSLTIDEQTAIQQARTVLSIDLAHEEALRQTHRRFAAELFDLAAREGEGHSPEIAQRLTELGLEPNGGLVAIMCDRPEADEWLGHLEDALAAAGLRAVATTRAGRLVAVAEWTPAEPLEPLATHLTTAMGADAAVGLGTVVSHCALLDASVADARRACRLARLRQDDAHAATASELTSHAGLLAQQDPDLLEHFRHGLLGPLDDYDAAHGSALLATLEAFLMSGGRWAPTAEQLHVHVNTLRHRLARVEALTGRRLDDPDDRVDLHLALRAGRRASP